MKATPGRAADRVVSRDPDCRQVLATIGQSVHSYYGRGLKSSTLMDKVETLLGSRTDTEQYRIDRLLTKAHADDEMLFQVKNPKTGFYDGFAPVDVNGIIAPISDDAFQSLVASIEPLMQELRALLQKIYSSDRLTVRDLGLRELSSEDARLVLHIIGNSIYFEPKLRAPQMSEYPFLVVGGFDGAIGELTNPEPRFFEMNLGTPSGISNNVQLLSHLTRVDPELSALLRGHLPEDNTFEILRSAIESNAAQWTRRKDGISVVIGPGIYNGAHPDVAAIAKFTGMPLVRSSDLYEDREGFIRLDAGVNAEHPVVTGIYGRAEESFFLQSNADGIPIISPDFVETNRRLAESLGIEMRPGAIYAYVKDKKGNPVDVERDAEGRPVYEQIADQLGTDPRDPRRGQGSLARAILGRKLYYSALGGRVVDDKRLFHIITRHLMAMGVTHCARQVDGIGQNEFSRLYEDPERFVVKEPIFSGGVGVYFPVLLGASEKKALLAKVRKQPREYEVQYVVDVTVLDSVQERSGKLRRSEVATDTRIYAIMDGDGHVRAGPHSLLVRTAPHGGLYTNTSRGGGYGIGVVYRERRYSRRPVTEPPKEKQKQNTPVIAHARRRELFKLLSGMRALFMQIQLAGPEQRETIDLVRTEALPMSYDLRNVMDILPTELLPLISFLREVAEVPYDSRAMILELRDRLLGFFRIASALRVSLNFFRERGDFLKVNWGSGKEKHMKTLPDSIRIHYFDEPEVAYENKVNGNARLESGMYTRVDNPEVQALIEEIGKAGGEIRHLFARQREKDGTIRLSWHPPYFWVNLNQKSRSYLKPVIAIDLTQDRALAALEHEMTHFRFWRRFYEASVSRGLSREDAIREATTLNLSHEAFVESERAALTEELKTESEHPLHPFNQFRTYKHKKFFYQMGYVNRILYPEFEGLRILLSKEKWSLEHLDLTVAEEHFQNLIRVASQTREKALAWPDLQERERWEAASLLDLAILPHGLERLRENLTLGRFVSLFHIHERKMGFPPSPLSAPIVEALRDTHRTPSQESQ